MSNADIANLLRSMARSMDALAHVLAPPVMILALEAPDEAPARALEEAPPRPPTGVHLWALPPDEPAAQITVARRWHAVPRLHTRLTNIGLSSAGAALAIGAVRLARGPGWAGTGGGAAAALGRELVRSAWHNRRALKRPLEAQR